MKSVIFRTTSLVLIAFAAGWASAADSIYYVVQPKDNPWTLTQRYLKGLAYWPRLVRLNHIADPAHIKPGTRLSIPLAWLQRTDSEVRLESAHGAVSVSTPDAAGQRQAVNGSVLTTGASVHTGAAGSATLRFADHSRVLLLPDSDLAIIEAGQLAAGAGNVVRLELQRGHIENRITPLAGPAGRFEIRTPAAVAAVRGTEFRVSAEPGVARTEVLGGLVDLGNSAGRQPVQPGFGTLAEAGKTPRPPVALLAAPALESTGIVLERIPADVRFAAVERARAYRTQIASNSHFESILASELSEDARARISDLPDGAYFLRVRGVDADGLEGLAATQPFTLHARPEPPTLISPSPEQILVEPRPSLGWTTGVDGTHYHLQIAQGADFTAPMVDLPDLLAGSVRPDRDLPPGTYVWRVAAVTATQGQGPFSDRAGFRVLVPSPGVEAPDLTHADLSLRWRAAGDHYTYRLQLAQDSAFTQPLLDEKLDVARYDLKTPAAGSYFLRVSAIAPDGVASPWGATQAFVIAPPPPNRWPLLLLLVPLIIGL